METIIDSAFNQNHIFNEDINGFKDDAKRQDSLDDIFDNDESFINNKCSDISKSTENIPILNSSNHSTKEDMTGKMSMEIRPDMVHPNLKVSQEDFSLLKIIGKGGYGTVFLVRKINEPEMNQLFAMKVLKKARIICNEKDTVHTLSERNILKILKHPFLVKLHYAFQNQSNLYIVLEYCPGGELFSYLERQCVLSEPDACFYSSEIILAIGHLHSLGIIYRDLKLENILLDAEGHVKLTDFGLSKEGVNLTNTFCGTIEYMAPEILQCQGHGKEVDWWSLGTLLYDMLSGGPPFSPETSKNETAKNILEGELKFPESFSSEVIDFLQKLLTRDPKKRLGCKNDVEDIKAHQFFKVNNINWNNVYNKLLPPPFKPFLKSPTDVSLFDENFTTLKPAVTPSDNASFIPNDCFSGFSYVGNSIRESFFKDENFVGSVRAKRRFNRFPSQQPSEVEANGIEFRKTPNMKITTGSLQMVDKNSPSTHSKSNLFTNGKNPINLKMSQSTVEEAEEVVDTMEIDENRHSSSSKSLKQSTSNQALKNLSFNDLPSMNNHQNGPYSQSSDKNQNCVIS